MIDLQLGYLENKMCRKSTAFTMYYCGYVDVKCIPKTPCMKELVHLNHPRLVCRSTRLYTLYI